MRAFSILAAFGALAASLIGAQPALAGDLAGTVADARAQPVAGIVVAIPALGMETRTDASGAYSFADLPEGEHEVAVSLGAEAVQFASAKVPAEGAAKRNIFLLSRAVVTTARSGMSPDEAAEAARITSEGMQAAKAMLESTETRAAPEMLADASRG